MSPRSSSPKEARTSTWSKRILCLLKCRRVQVVEAFAPNSRVWVWSQRNDMLPSFFRPFVWLSFLRASAKCCARGTTAPSSSSKMGGTSFPHRSSHGAGGGGPSQTVMPLTTWNKRRLAQFPQTILFKKRIEPVVLGRELPTW